MEEGQPSSVPERLLQCALQVDWVEADVAVNLAVSWLRPDGAEEQGGLPSQPLRRVPQRKCQILLPVIPDEETMQFVGESG